MEGRADIQNPLFMNITSGMQADVGEETVGTNISNGGPSYDLGGGSSNQDESLNGSSSLFLNDEEDEWSGSGDEVEAESESEPELIVIKDMVDIMKIDLHNFRVADIRKYEFVVLDVAYMFYCWFAKLCGFSVRKGHVVKNRDGNIIQQTFLCSCAGFREDRGLSLEKRKRVVKNETRCGCDARFKVHLDIVCMRWYVTLLEIDHKHDLLGGTLCGLLPAHRKMSQSDIDEIERNRKAGIRPYQVYGSMANTSGGFHKVGFVKKDLYNQIGRQRKLLYSDACGAVKYLQELSKKDPLMFVAHSIDKERKLERLFWSDGESRMNFEIY